MNYHLEKFHKHKKIFQIHANPYLDLFENLLKKSVNFRSECSVKLEQGMIFPCRFNIGYQVKGNKRDLNISLGFIKDAVRLGAHVKLNLLKEIFAPKIDLTLIEEVLVGIDLREDPSQNRLKFWLITNPRYYALFNIVFKLYGDNEKVVELIHGNALLFGFDFFPDDRSRLKIYIPFESHELNNAVLKKRLARTFSVPVMELIGQSERIHVSFEEKTCDRIIHFHVSRVHPFLSLIKNQQLKKIIRCIGQPLPTCIVSIKETEINKGQIKELNFYY